jgi:hypothetical protein
MKRFRSAFGCAALFAGSALGLHAQASPPPPCAASEHRQFDFWLGEWEVAAAGTPVGHNRITPLFGACGLREEYAGARGGFAGTSFNVYDAARGVWHQTWIDNSGALLVLEGGLRDGRMVLEGQRPGPEGTTRRERIIWTPNSDATVRQLWEVSTDGGSTWSVVFDGLYRRRAAAAGS